MILTVPGDHVELRQQEPREEGGRPPTEAPSPLSSGQCSRPPRLLLYPLAIASPRMGHCEPSTLQHCNNSKQLIILMYSITFYSRQVIGKIVELLLIRIQALHGGNNNKQIQATFLDSSHFVLGNLVQYTRQVKDENFYTNRIPKKLYDTHCEVRSPGVLSTLSFICRQRNCQRDHFGNG